MKFRLISLRIGKGTLSKIMAITLTQSAARQVQVYLDRDASSIGLRFGVRASGCSGYAYIVELTDVVGGDDEVYETNGIKVLVDRESLPLVTGTEIDYICDKLSETFVFHNPNVTASCGCGESFTTRH